MSDAADQSPLDEVETQAASGPGIFQVAWRFKYLIVLGTVIGLVVGYIYASQLPPSYQSKARILVVKKRADVGFGDGRAAFLEDYVSTHQKIIESPYVVTEAVKKHKLDKLASFKGNPWPTGAIIGGLKVTRDMGDNSRLGTSILVLTYTGPIASDCGVIISAIIDSYSEFLGAKYKDVTKETVEYITNAKKLLDEEISHKEDELSEIRLKNPELRKGATGVTSVNERITTIDTKLSALKIQQTILAAKLEAFEQALKENRPREELVAIAWPISPAAPSATDRKIRS
jgi:polysaccharide biosynthesis transport protein